MSSINKILLLVSNPELVPKILYRIDKFPPIRIPSQLPKLLKDVAPQEALDFACAVGAIVASSEGANPEIKESDILSFMEQKTV